MDQAGVSGPSHVNGFQSVIIDNTSTTNEASAQDDDTPLDREASAKAREEAFNALSSKEKKVIITMLDPSGRKYPLPYFLVKTWEGMQYILEQAFLNIEGIGPRIAKAEYDLVNSDRAVIIPHLWETFIEPDMLVEVHIWPNSSPQMQSSLPTPESIPPVNPVPSPSPPTPQRHSPPTPSRHSSPPPRRSSPPSRRSVPPPRSAAPRSYISVARRHRSTSRTSSHGSSSHKTSGKSVNWSLLWSPRPSKAKPKKWRPLPYSISLPPPPPYSSYESSYDDCTCWECRYTYIAYQQQPLEPDPVASQFKVKYPQVTRDVVKTKSFKKETAECLESILEVEPIFEIEGEQIYELE